MLTDLNTPLPDTPFWRAYDGKFQGVLSWADFDALWARLETSDAVWFVFDLEREAPATPLDAAQFRAVLAEARDMYAPVRKQGYCGAVYVDDKSVPTLLKVFDPHRMGGVCGSSGERTLPRWTFSQMRPDPVPAASEPPAKHRLLSRFNAR